MVRRVSRKLRTTMPKKVVDTKTETSTKTSTEPDGTIVEVITTTITEKYDDGSTGVRTETKTIRKAPGSGKGSGGKGNSHAQLLDSNLTPAASKAHKIPNTTEQAFIDECLETHNKLRAKHGAPPLSIDHDLAKIAQAWAKELAKLGKMKHSTTGFGENVYWNTDKPPGSRPAEAWYSEIKDYNWKKLEGQKGTGHFTQLIWKSTKLIGIAMEHGENGYFVVANYYPPGNVIGKFPDNIQK